MAIALVQSATQVNVSASSATSLTIVINGVVAGNALVAYGSIFDGNNTWTISSIADAGNTWATLEAAAQFNATQRSRASLAYAVNVTGGARTITWTLAGTSGAGGRFYVLGVSEFSGVASASPLDDSATNANIAAGTDANAGGTGFTTTAAGSLITGTANPVSALTNMAFVSPTSWTNTYRQNDANTFAGMDAGYWLPGATQTDYTAQWSHANTVSPEESAAIVIALLAATPLAGTLGQWDPELRIAAWF